jgi:hypothetical protein
MTGFVTLKNIKHAEFASQETHCYEATLYVDGARWGVVSNEGHGGADMFHGERPYRDSLKALDERIAREYPKIEFDGMEPMDASLETVCGYLVNQWLAQRDIARELTRCTKGKVGFFKEPPAKGASIFTIPLGSTPLDKVVDHVRTKYPGAVVLNTMPKPEALAVLERVML